MQGRGADDHATNRDWLEYGIGGGHPGTANLDHNIMQDRDRLFPAIFNGHSPARILTSETQTALEGKFIHLDHQAIDFVG